MVFALTAEKDVSTAYLHSELKGEGYVTQSEFFFENRRPLYDLKLKKAYMILNFFK